MGATPLVIRRASDTTDVRRLDRICFPLDDPPDFDGTTWWLAREGDDAVAYAGARRVDDIAYLSRAGVIPRHRGRRLQRRLIRTRLRWAKALGLAWALTYTVPTNTPSANSLIACGFRLYEPGWPWAGDDVLYWRKPL